MEKEKVELLRKIDNDWMNGKITISELPKGFFDDMIELENETIDTEYLEKYLRSVSLKERESIEKYLEGFDPKMRNIALRDAIETNWPSEPKGLTEIVNQNFTIQVKISQSVIGKVFPSLVRKSRLINFIRELKNFVRKK